MSFTSNYPDIHSQLSVTNEPQAHLNLGSLDFEQLISIHDSEKGLENNISHHHHDCEHGQASSCSEHHSYHNNRPIRFLLAAIFALVALGGLLAWSCVNWHSLPVQVWDYEVDLIGRTFSDPPNEKWYKSTWFCQLVPLTHKLVLINRLRDFYSYCLRERRCNCFFWCSWYIYVCRVLPK